MAKNKLQFNHLSVERERFSNFVVDLRRVEKKAVAEVKEEEGKLSKKVAAQLGKLENRLKKIRPNLLAASKPHRPFRFKKLTWPRTPQFSFARLRNLFTLPQTQPDYGRRFIKAQERIFNRPPRAERAARLARVESTVVWYRSLFSFVLVLLLIILPFKVLSYFQLFDLQGWENKIRGRSELALSNLLAAAGSVASQDFKDADFKFQAAGANFLAAADDLNKINDTILSLAALSGDPRVKMAAESKKILNAGIITSSLGRNLVLATDSLFGAGQNNFSAALDQFLKYGHQAASDAGELKKTLARIESNNLPAAYRSKFISLKDQAALLADNLDNFVTVGDRLKGILGLSRDKRYLVVFQNNAELRASGGFLGSYALVDLRDGKIRNLEVPGGGSYDTEAGLNVRVAAPQPLWLVNPLWHFWDANWWPDWPTTAKNLMWFYEHSDGPSVDGVISVTPTVVERLLEITGPIDLTEQYGLVIDSNNFWQTVQVISEQTNLAKTNPAAVANLPAPVAGKPKKIIGDLLAKILEVLPTKLNKDNLLKIMTIFEENMAEKQILLYFTDPVAQAEVAGNNWGGEIKDTPKDYLLVVNTNIAGQKSDRLISENITVNSAVSTDGTIINTVEIKRTHNGVKREILTGVRNVDWLRVYVPVGSELLFAGGFQPPDPKYLTDRPDATMESDPLLKEENAAAIDPESGTKIYRENGKTVFANWAMVDPGQTTTIILKYRLPFNFLTTPVNDSWLKRLSNWLNSEANELISYSLLVQKQPGAKPSTFSARLTLPDNLKIFWRYPENLSGLHGWEINDHLNADKYWSILTTKK